MISRNSRLRRLPAALDRKQALFLDGIRHAGEIAGLAYPRLQATLARIATQDLSPEVADQLYTSAFLDAWALVDVIDRFRALWVLLPGAGLRPTLPGEKSFAEISQPIRDLRNVADHLAQRADYVVARNGTALGVLSWFTPTDIANPKGVICTIVPGTLQKRSTHTVNPAGQKIDLPSGLVQLSAGEHAANISQVLPHMEARIRELEAGVDQSLNNQGYEIEQAGADLLIKMFVEFEGQASTAEGSAREA